MVNMTTQQTRRQERHRFRAYFRSLAKVAPEVFYRKTARDLKSACVRSALSDAVLIARAIHKRNNRQQQQQEQQQQQQSNEQEEEECCQSAETSEQRFIRIFVAPFADHGVCDPDKEEEIGNSPLQAAAYAGAASMVHFILSCYVLFLLKEECFTSEPHTIMAWMHKVGVHQQESTEDNANKCWREELILTMVGSSFHYLYERKYSLLELLQFVTPYLAPYSRLEQFVSSLATKAKHLATNSRSRRGGGGGEPQAHSILDDSDDEEFRYPKFKTGSSMPDLCALEREDDDSAVLVDVPPGVLSFVGSLGEFVDDDDDDVDDLALVKEDIEDVDWEVVSDDSSVLSF